MSEPDNNDITVRAGKGSFFTLGASVVTATLGFVRITLLLRILSPSDFGISTLALFYVTLFSRLFSLGLDDAFIHRLEINEKFRRTFLTLRVSLPFISMTLLMIALPIIIRFYPDYPLLAQIIIAYAILQIIQSFVIVQDTMLRKNMAFKQIAIAAIVGSVVMTIIAPLSAKLGLGVWSLVIEQYVGLLANLLLIFLFFRPWTPKFGWERSIATWFRDYGKHIWGTANLTFLLDQFDDWFVGTFLGSQALGYYSRAYEYAGYPRRVLANPMQAVFLPTFAHLQNEPEKLSRVFFKMTSFMIRIGGLFSLIFIMSAPEFIPLILGEKWLPMLATFQLMIIYTLFDPLSKSAMNLLHATGHPRTVMHIRILQAIIFIPAVILLGLWLGIEGVAIAANIMVLIGVIRLYHKTKLVTHYSQRALWFWPLTAVVVTALILLMMEPIWASLTLWASLFCKIGLITTIYGAILWLTEKNQLLAGWQMIWNILKSNNTKTN